MNLASAQLESDRIQILENLNRQKTADQRNQWGQFATPPDLADQIIDQALRMMPSANNIRFLEPGFGTGSFFAALQRTSATIGLAKGIELDPHFVVAARRLYRGTGLRIVSGDFTELPSPTRPSSQFDLIVCNPPYVRHHHLDAEAKRRMQDQISHQLGLSISGLAGLYAYFLLRSQAWMKPAGVGAWLIPAEFMDVNYGRSIRQFLTRHVTLLRIHRFDSTEVQFDDALVSSVVLFFRNNQTSAGQRMEMTTGGTVSSPKRSETMPTSDLRPDEKWKTSMADRSRTTPAGLSSAKPLSDWFMIKRGIATGGNQFFVVNEAEIDSRALPRDCFRPILPSPRYMSESIIRSRSDGSPDIDHRNFLLDCDWQPSEIANRSKPLARYLQIGRRQGIPMRYLCRHRDPWYRQEHRDPAPFLCSYMGRASPNRMVPFRFYWNQSQAIAANVYLMLYPRPPLKRVMAGNRQKTMLVFDRLRMIEQESMIHHGRVYGGGLHKLEPKELANVPIDFSDLGG